MTPKQKEQILQEIRTMIAGTDFENHVFMVGGAVRDELMGLPVKDLDICVDLPDGGIKLALFITHQQQTYRKKSHPELFQAYGIARFHLAAFPHIELECVQTRKERYENRDSRNPVTEFAPLPEDCLRRDLTINALYKNISTGEIVDITGNGLPDLKNHIVRTPRQPFITFDEDGLRLLRVIRFASRFGWTIEAETFQGLKDCASRITTITQDRITDEISRMLCGANPAYALRLLKETGLLQYVMPEWNEMPEQQWNFLLQLAETTAPELDCKLTAMLYLTGAEEALCILRRMNYPVDMQKKVQALHHCLHDLDDVSDDTRNLSDAALRELQYRWGESAPKVLDIIEAVMKYQPESKPDLVGNIRQRNRQMQEEGTACFALKLPVNGKDIMQEMQLKPGPQIKDFMNRALALCFENPRISKAEILKHLINIAHC